MILGGGFGGIGAAKKLRKSDLDVVLVDGHDYHTFQPLLYQLATGLLDQAAVAHPIRDLFHKQENIRVHQDQVTEIDLDAREVRFSELQPERYDYLVLALGAEVNFFGVDGAAEHAFPLYTLADAMRLKDHVLERWEAADRNPELVEDGALNMVVVGGGPTGVETAGAMAELYTVFAKDYPDVDPEQAKIVLVEASPEIFAMFKPDIRSYTEKALEDRGVEVMTGEVVASVSPERVTLKSGTVLSAHTLVWGAGLQANELVRSLGLELERGNRLAVDEELRLPQHPEVYAVGDIAAITDDENRSGSAPARLGRAPVRGTRRRDDRPPGRGQGDEAVQVPRQGHDGDDRPGRGRRPDARRPDDERQGGTGGVGNRSPRAAADQLGPREGGRRLGGRRAHAPALRPDQGQDLGRGGARWRPQHRRSSAAHRRQRPHRPTCSSCSESREISRR